RLLARREERRAARQRRDERSDEDGRPGRGRGEKRQPGRVRAERPARDADGPEEAAQGRRRVSADAHLRERRKGTHQRARARDRRQGEKQSGLRNEALDRLSRTKKILLLAAAAAIAGTAAAILLRPGDTPSIAGFVYPEPKAISPFRLSAQDGKPF